MEYKKMLRALSDVEEQRNISEAVILEALNEAVAKAYKKDAELQDIDVVAELNEKKKKFDLYQNYLVLESDDDVQDDELEIGLEEARAIDPTAEVGGKIRRPIEEVELSRAAVSIAKNVIRQKIREAEKSAVYDEYKDKVDEMFIGVVESVKDKFALINLGKSVALMPHSAQIPGEVLREGDKTRVVITAVNKDTKGSQVLVSRADAMLVKRLFEKEVPEIYNGIVEIKAIARDAGDRTKMAVLSHNPDIDPIGACIGPRGNRVQNIIDELNGEKIDIFEYSNDVSVLVKNALAPAVVTAVLPGRDYNSLLVIVDAAQLSLAIGKRGKNARLAVKLTNHKIDIKTREEIEEAGMDYEALLAQAEVLKQKAAEKTEKENEMKRAEAIKEQEEKKAAAAEKIAALKENAGSEDDDFIPEEMMETLSENVLDEMDDEDTKEEETAANEEAPAEVEEPVVEEDNEVEEEVESEEPLVEEKKSNKHADLEEMAANNTYVSKFEKLADTSKKAEAKGKKKFKKKSDEDNYKLSNKELQQQLKDKLAARATASQIYSEEELAEIEAQQEAEEEKEYDIDYDEYEDYYGEDE